MTTDGEKSLIRGAMKSIEDQTCVRFKKRQNKEKDFLKIMKGDGYGFES